MQADDEMVAASLIHELQTPERDPKRLAGYKTPEVEMLNEALAVAQAKKPRRRPQALAGEGCVRRARRGPLRRCRANAEWVAIARSLSSCRRRGRSDRHLRHHERTDDLRLLSPDGDPEPGAARHRRGGAEPRALHCSATLA